MKVFLVITAPCTLTQKTKVLCELILTPLAVGSSVTDFFIIRSLAFAEISRVKRENMAFFPVLGKTYIFMQFVSDSRFKFLRNQPEFLKTF